MAIPILLYHSISSDASPLMRPFAAAPESFRRQLDLIVESGARVLTVSGYVELAAAGHLPERPLLLTFDDGFADFSEQALPALRERRLPCTLYVTTGFLDGCPGGVCAARPADRMLHWSQLAELAAQGVEIGAHSHSHPHLDTLSRRRAWDEVVRCKGLLEDELQAAIHSFAYPNGYSSPAVRRLVREAGYGSACSVKNAFSSPGDDRYSLARLTVRSTTTLDDLAGWLAGRGAPSAPPRESFRTRLWRVYRRTRALASGRPGSDLT
jgi:peptidoglycan/xylan/chitin deacetylase (PgdA/CDA1 family)